MISPPERSTARIETSASSPYGMTFTEGTDVNLNTKNNNINQRENGIKQKEQSLNQRLENQNRKDTELES